MLSLPMIPHATGPIDAFFGSFGASRPTSRTSPDDSAPLPAVDRWDRMPTKTSAATGPAPQAGTNEVEATMVKDETNSSVPTQVERLQELRRVDQLQGHEVCADVHRALDVAQAVLTSRNERVADMSEAESSATLIRELRAIGVEEAAPQLIAMVAVVDTAVDRIADAGGMSENDAWELIRKDVLRKHCQGPRA
jgi:uncharacterized protein (DUF2267 family)